MMMIDGTNYDEVSHKTTLLKPDSKISNSNVCKWFFYSPTYSVVCRNDDMEKMLEASNAVKQCKTEPNWNNVIYVGYMDSKFASSHWLSNGEQYLETELF